MGKIIVSNNFIDSAKKRYERIGEKLGRSDEVKNRILLPEGTELPIFIDGDNAVIDESRGSIEVLKKDTFIDANSASVALALSLRARETRRFRILERELYFKQDISETTGLISAGQTTYSWPLISRVGKAILSRGDKNNTTPYVDISAEEFVFKNKFYNLGYIIGEQELLSSVFTGVPLRMEKEDAVLRGFAETQNSIAYFGERDLNETGLLNNPYCVAGQVAQGAGGNREWSTKTGAEILKDILARAEAMNTASKGVIKPDTLLVPMKYREVLAQPYDASNSSNITIGQMIIDSMQTANEGKPFKLAFRAELEGAYTGGLDMFVLYEKNESFLEFLTAQQPKFLAPQFEGYSLKMLAGAYYVGTVVRYPLAISYGYNV